MEQFASFLKSSLALMICSKVKLFGNWVYYGPVHEVRKAVNMIQSKLSLGPHYLKGREGSDMSRLRF